MACRFEVTLDGEARTDIPAASRALMEADRLEALWSVFRDDSLMSGINLHAADGPVCIDAELHALLVRCAAWHADTGGAFDITSTPLSRCWHFLDRAPRVPEPDELAAARERVGATGIVLDESGNSPTVRFARKGMALNLGAVGKGYAVSRIAGVLAAGGVRDALVSAGGSSVAALGGRGRGWPIAVCTGGTHRRPIANLWLRDAAMATSGAGEQGVEIEGVRYGHIIDPRSGWPARGVRSVTVVAGDGADADALATACFVGGVPLAERLCASHSDVLVVMLPDADARARIMGRRYGAHVEVA
jgi:thiamine biosynthesis lipoprotein